MKNVIVVYGSSTGTCEAIACHIAQQLGVEAISASQLTAEVVSANDVLLLGTSTWGAGEVQDDWYAALKVLRSSSLAGKVVALFGCGDSSSYSDTFCGGMAQIYDAANESGATIVGAVDASAYSFDASDAVVDGHFVGLALDNDNESDKTPSRIEAWLLSIAPSLA